MLRLGVRVAREQAELVLAELLVLAPGGVEERDVADGVVEYAVYGAEGEIPALGALRAVAGDALVEVVTEQVADDWADRWRTFHRPLDVGLLHVRPPWTPAPAPGRIDIVVDPGQAFGTGAHPTTRTCLELLGGVRPGGALMDLGCGSGVLAIAAAKLGWSPVQGVDFDALAVEATRENAQRNGVEVAARQVDLLGGGPVPSAPTVVANLLRPLLEHVAAVGFAAPGPEVLIASGLLLAEADGAAAALGAATGLTETARLEDGDWAALRLG